MCPKSGMKSWGNILLVSNNYMNILVVNFCVLAALALCYYNHPHKPYNIKVYVLISCMLFVFIRTFIDIRSVPDLEFYSLGYRQIADIEFLKIPSAAIYDVKIPEFGFRYLMKICSIICTSFTFFLFIYGLLWTIGYVKVIKRYSAYVILSILFVTIESYNQSLFVIRQHLAMLIVFFSYQYVIEKNIYKYLLMMLLAYSLHQTAVIAIPLYFLYHIKGRKKLLFSMLAVGSIVFVMFSLVMSKFGGEMLIGYSSYIDSDVQTNATGAILIGFELFAYVLVLKGNVFNAGINRVLFISLSLGFIMSFCGIGFNPTSRLVMYYTSISFLVVPKIAEYANSKISRALIVFLFIVLYGYMSFYGSGFESLKDFRLDV